MNHRMFTLPTLVALVWTWLTFAATTAHALDDAHWQKANQSLSKGIAYLRSQQNADGSWMPQPGPAVTAMVVRILLDQPDVSTDDPAVQKGLSYIMSKVKPDGGIHDGILENYNTAIVLSALALANDQPGVPAAITNAQNFLRDLQWSNQHDPQGRPIDENHPFYGGAGYGRHGRPDMSNLQIMLEGLHDSGLDCNDPAFQRALVFISRCQGIESNTMFADKIELDGGFIYATSVNKDKIGVPQSYAEDGDGISPEGSRLSTYGSMTYAGFKSYVYAQLDRNDPRVQAAYHWIRRHYTLEQNPGLPESRKHQGYFYFLMTFSRAMDVWGSTYVETLPDGEKRNWANDLIAKIASLQNEDGSVGPNLMDRWMEGDAVLTTAYCMIALQHARD